MLEPEDPVEELLAQPEPAPLATAPEGLVVVCADIGSVKQGNFGWWSSAGASGTRPSTLVDHLHDLLATSRPVALGFECPLFVPLPEDELMLTSARPGENSRAWSAGAGCGALATGLTEVTWCLKRLRELCDRDPRTEPATAFTSWPAFALIQAAQTQPALYLWEAFVSSTAKSKATGKQALHVEDAEIGARAFLAALPDPDTANAIRCEGEVHSLLGAALLRAGWTEDVQALSLPCLVIRAT